MLSREAHSEQGLWWCNERGDLPTAAHGATHQGGLKPPQPIPVLLPFPSGKLMPSPVLGRRLQEGFQRTQMDGWPLSTEDKRQHNVGANAVLVQMLDLVQPMRGLRSCPRPNELLPGQ